MQTKLWHRAKRIVGTVGAVAVAATCGTTTAHAEDQTVKEFKSYVSEKTDGRLSEAQLDELAKRVDKNGDGLVSESEFADRMSAFRKVTSGSSQKSTGDPNRAERKSENEVAAAKVVVVPKLADSDNATILLVTADEIAQAWLPFGQWKTASGKLTKIVTISQIAQEYDADSLQEKIRLCVRDHIENHQTRWVVLGGDSLPGGKGLVPGGHTTVHSQERAGIPTDIVYLSKSNWDADGDGIYGEFEDDRSAITYPDGSVGLGRIPVRTADDVAAFTDKVIAFESRYPKSDFANQMIYTCTDSPAYPKVRNSWDQYVSKVWQGEMGRYFSKETPWDDEGEPGSYPLSANNLVELLNSKTIGKFHIHGHGHLPAWVLEGSRFTADHVQQLKNDGAYPLITTVSCNTGEYDSKKDPSIVERMIRQPKAGSVAIVAPVRTGKPHFAKRSDMRRMVTEGLLDGTTLTMTRYWATGLGSGLTTGESLMSAKSDMAKDGEASPNFHLCICELNLLGDPTLDMRAKAPRDLQVKMPGRIGVEKQTIQVKTDCPGCQVCLWKGMEIYDVAQANESGDTSFSVQPSTVGEILVTVSGTNLNTLTRKIQVVKTDSTLNEPSN